MLRDLGGLIYEVHRSGGGDYGAHSGVIGGKVERLAALDAESGAIEEALGARRADTVVFQPGVGGTCNVCGELYGSAARFCSHCGAPAGAPAEQPQPAPEPRQVPPMPKPPAAAPGDRPTDVLESEARPAAEQPRQPGHNPYSGISNGRPDGDDTPPDLSSGDPLAARESRQ
jgi:hypothetical protein